MLNENQSFAVRHKDGPMLVLAGPGSGKTTVIVYRVKQLIDVYKVKPYEILVVTFTKAAAIQMQQRYQKLCPHHSTQPMFGTLHSLFFRILRKHCSYRLEDVISEEEKYRVLRELVRTVCIETDDEEDTISDFLTDYCFMKNELLTLEQYSPCHMRLEDFTVLANHYDSYKAAEKKIDFDDMLYQCYYLLKENTDILNIWREKFCYLLVDEFQDINKAQYESIKLLASPKNNLFVVGDDDQSIYCFRGARPEFLLNFPIDFQNTQKVVLNINYRSSDIVIRLGNRLIKHNRNRYQKVFHGVSGKGQTSEFFSVQNSALEAEKIAEKIMKLHQQGVPLREFAVLFRTNLQATAFCRMFSSRGIPFLLKDNISSLFDHWITKDILAYLNYCRDFENKEAFFRIANKPKRYLSRQYCQQLKKMSGSPLQNILSGTQLEPWQVRTFQKWEEQMHILCKLPVYEGILYIRNEIGYDAYLKEYAQYRKANLTGLLEILGELTQLSKDMKTLDQLYQRAEAFNEQLKNAKHNRTATNIDCVTLSTIHSAKGLEFEAVYIPSLVEGLLPYEKAQTKEEIEEERRLFYVAMTRSKQFLTFSEVREKFDHPTTRSRFLKELGLAGRMPKK